MTLRVAAQMDPIAGIDIQADSTFRILFEAQARGHHIFTYLPDTLSWTPAGAKANAQAIRLRDTVGDHFTAEAAQSVSLTEFDVILLRQDPPFDMHYVTTTHLLEHVAGEVLVVNDPFWVRNAPEKLSVLLFPDLMPPTLVSRDPETIAEFRAAYGDIIIKPLYGNGGEGVFRLKPDDANFNPLLETVFAARREAVVVQQFLSAVLEQGDRRLILIDGELVGGILRVPPSGETRSNLHVGGRAEPWEVNDRDREIAARVGPMLKERGLIFAGLDVIHESLTEINVTSPTGIQELERFGGPNSAAKFWDAVELRLADRQQ